MGDEDDVKDETADHENVILKKLHKEAKKRKEAKQRKTDKEGETTATLEGEKKRRKKRKLSEQDIEEEGEKRRKLSEDDILDYKDKVEDVGRETDESKAMTEDVGDDKKKNDESVEEATQSRAEVGGFTVIGDVKKRKQEKVR